MNESRCDERLIFLKICRSTNHFYYYYVLMRLDRRAKIYQRTLYPASDSSPASPFRRVPCRRARLFILDKRRREVVWSISAVSYCFHSDDPGVWWLTAPCVDFL
jgi:hypothetical protein